MGESDRGARPFSGIRVAEFGRGHAAAYCGKLFADFGAEVVKVEPPGGDPDRRLWPPFADVGGGAKESALFAWLNTNKASIIADPDDAERLGEIAGAADVLIDGRHGAGWNAGPSGHAALRAAFPHLHIVSLSWFGESGPYRDYAGADAVVRALAGCVRQVGEYGKAPIVQPQSQAYLPGALSAFSAVVASLIADSPGGRKFEVSLQEANACEPEFQAAVTVAMAAVEQRWGLNRFFPVFPCGIYPTKDGWLGVTAFSNDQWRGFCDMLGLKATHANPEFATAPQRFMLADAVDAQIAPALMQRTAREWSLEGLRRRVPLVAIPSMADLLASPAHRAHGAFGRVRIGEATFEAPVAPQHLNATPPAHDGAAPLAGAHTKTWRPAPRRQRIGKDGGLPLAGVRIVDLTMGWAGPLATRQLADLGAEVIKVESRVYPDWWRGGDYTEAALADQLHEKALYFQFVNRNKTGITLDLTRPEGADLLKQLVRTADAVIENYAQDVLPRFGLDYAGLVRERADLVMVSMPPYGANTDWAELRGYGSTLEHGSGLPGVTGFEGAPPTMNHVAYGDPIGGLNACAAMLTALLHRKRTGKGQFVDLSQIECLFPLVAPWIIEQSVTGKVGPRLGNRHPVFVPHGVFPCDGDDAWIVIAVTDDRAWAALCEVTGRSDLASDAALATVAGRRAAEDVIEAAIAAWTKTQSADEAMEALQASGVAAGVARGFHELMLYEPQLTARGYWQDVPRVHLDFTMQPSPAFREDGEPYPIRNPAPTLGQSTREVLGRILGVTAADLDRLEAEQVIGEAPIPMAERRPRSSAVLHEAAAGGGD
ncbi:MAG TPA: CoA transferase [Caulobacteraceae bacterium]|nr:CoA transferase [Caulobacteraceae bacterium]